MGDGWRDRLPRARLAAVRRHAGSLAPLLSALDAYEPRREEVSAVAVPTLVVRRAGAAPLDRLVAERLVAWLPEARLATLPDPADPVEPLMGATGAALAASVLAFLAERRGEEAEGDVVGGVGHAAADGSVAGAG